ncbi:MAG TPA: ATP synthase F1 subunit delta [Chitinophagaceae bacterium]|nr:ATP synthase F1 subunit delta [Chitinophagaceae bacterium]
MQNHRLAERYAKSLMDLAIEFNQLDIIHQDILTLQSICRMSRDFVLMLNSPIIKHDKKIKIITAVTNGKVSALTQNFIKLLCTKGRESNLPEIIYSFAEQYNEFKGIHKVKLTTAIPVSDGMKNLFIKKIQTSAGITNIQLETKVDEKLIGGFVLEMDGKLVDASILRDLNDVKKQFANNDYIHKLR